MGKKIITGIALSLWGALLVILLWAGLYNYVLPSEISIAGEETLPDFPCVSLCERAVYADAFSDVSVMDAKLFGVVSLKKIEVKDYSNLKLIPSGQTFGVRLYGDGVCVVGTAEVTSGGKSVSPAARAGLAPRDLILSVNDTPVKSVTDLKTAIENAKGAPVRIRYRRAGEEKSTVLTPILDDGDGKYKTGMWVKDSATGIGTVSYIHPETGEFGALGHGVCDGETGTLLPLSRGVVTDAVVTDVIKGTKGKPGELKGYLKAEKTGALTQNTECGVFGVIANAPKQEAIPVAPASAVKTGKATLRTMLDGDVPVDYEIEIIEVHAKSPNKSFTVKVTDPRLLAKTGGIVQGMSGSPMLLAS